MDSWADREAWASWMLIIRLPSPEAVLTPLVTAISLGIEMPLSSLTAVIGDCPLFRGLSPRLAGDCLCSSQTGWPPWAHTRSWWINAATNISAIMRIHFLFLGLLQSIIRVLLASTSPSVFGLVTMVLACQAFIRFLPPFLLKPYKYTS